jgi:uncharacterized protein YndB with AHSA1/START domain
MTRFFYATYIKTTPKQLWNALTNPEFTEQYWWGRRLESDWKVGSEIKALYDDNKIDWQGQVLEFQPYTKLSYTFHLEDRPDLMKDKPSKVTFEISSAGKSTMKLTVTHVELSEKAFNDVSEGWPALLSSLKSLLESGKPLEYDET